MVLGALTRVGDYLMDNTKRFDVIVVGAGFAGMYALYKLRKLGFAVQVYEAGSGVGGTWFWNRYPGARCDVNSLEYSYQFSDELQQEWNWSERYSGQPEILEYAKHVADRFELAKDIQFNTRVLALEYNESTNRWSGKTDQGDHFDTQFCVMATGCLSKHNVPDIEGLDRFQGELLHTGKWPHSPVDFKGKSVGVIGTGSSGIQSIPIIAEQASSLTVFQRTPNFSIPAHNRPMDKNHEAEVKRNYREFRKENALQRAAIRMTPNPESALAVSQIERDVVFEKNWLKGGLPFSASFSDIGINLDANATAVDFVHRKIKNLVEDPEVAEKLCPKTVIGCKRLCVDTGYYKTFNRTNVSLVDIKKEPIKCVTESGVSTSEDEYEFDALVLATGFDAMTGAILSIDIKGQGKQTLAKRWEAGPKNYLGLTINGFPNLFTITGPGSPSVLSNMIVAIEQHVDFLSELLNFMQKNNKEKVEANLNAEDNWVELVNNIADQTLYTSGCNSWYVGANIPGKPSVFMPYIGFPTYVEKCKEIVKDHYRGFEFS